MENREPATDIKMDQDTQMLSLELSAPPKTSKRLQILERARKAVILSGLSTIVFWVFIGVKTQWEGLGVFGAGCLSPVTVVERQNEPMTKRGWVKWSDIVPSEELVYHPCFDGFECARLSVPLNWMNTTDPERAAIAIVKVPAEVPETDKSWGGPILLNPGGPGGSGVEQALASGKRIQKIVGKQFSVLGFDPRGINNTTPRVTCFHTNIERQIWDLRSADELLGSTKDGDEISRAYSRAKALGETCAEKLQGKGGEHVGTSVVARDMLAITQRAWDAVGVNGEARGLQYWGFSYGTVLGMVYAAMFPDRVERLVVDGVVDTDDYFATNWLHNLQDLPLVFSSFSTYCSLAGPLCKFNTGSTPAHISSRLQHLLYRISRLPISVPHSPYGPETVTKSDVLTYIFRCLYSPLLYFPQLATILYDLENGDGLSFVKTAKEGISCACGEEEVNWGEVSSAVLCSDGVPVNDTLEEFREYVSELREQASDMGGVWAQIRLGCIGWGVRPAWRFEGKLVANTSWPLLFIGNSADPVTPLRNAHKMSMNYYGSVVLQQNSEGHCSVSSPSLCTAKYIHDYFKSGNLPHPGTVCDADVKPFQNTSSLDTQNTELSPEEVELRDAGKELSEEWARMVLGLSN